MKMRLLLPLLERMQEEPVEGVLPVAEDSAKQVIPQEADPA